ncbi:MAG: CvpA family protein [Verrucomicrobiota bacterium]
MFATLPFDANWFDVIWAIALVFGLWSGLRCGALGEVIRLISWVLMVWLSLKYYEVAGDWVRKKMQLDEEPSRLIAFVGIIIGVYLISLLIRKLVSSWTKKSPAAAFLENFGGAALGLVRMALVMAVLTIWLSLVRSPFWHKHVSTNSKFGSAVVRLIPSVEKVTKKTFPETVPFFRDIERPIDADENDLATSKPKKAK